MKRPRRSPRGPKGGVQFFTYGPWEFNVSRALALAKGDTRGENNPEEKVFTHEAEESRNHHCN